MRPPSKRVGTRMTDEIENDVVSSEYWEARKLEIKELGRLGSDAHEPGPAEAHDPEDSQALKSAVDSVNYDTVVSAHINSLTLEHAKLAY